MNPLYKTGFKQVDIVMPPKIPSNIGPSKFGRPLPPPPPTVALPSSAPAIATSSPQKLLEKKLEDSACYLTPEEQIDLLSHCMQIGEKQAEKAEGKDLIVFIGNTGSGKSTLINYLFGCEMEGKTAQELKLPGLVGKKAVVKDKKLEIMPIGHSKKSMTFLPQVESDKKHLTYCDCPGFQDNRGVEINIANAVNIKNVMAKAASVKIVVVISFNSLDTERSNSLSSIIKVIKNLFGSEQNVLDNAQSIVLGITQLRAPSEEDVVQTLDQLRGFITSQTSSSDSFTLQTLKFLSESLFIYDPLERKNLICEGSLLRGAIINKLSVLKPIKQPEKIFKSILNSDDEREMVALAKAITTKIESFTSLPKLSEDNYKQMAELVKNLSRLEVIGNEFISKLLLEVKTNSILRHFNKLLKSFEISCAEGKEEAKLQIQGLFEEIKTGALHFDQQIQKEVNLPHLEFLHKQFSNLLAAKQMKEELQVLQKKFYDFCMQQTLMQDHCQQKNLIQAKLTLGSIQEKIKFYDNQFSGTKLNHDIDVDDLAAVFEKTKKKNEEAVQKEEAYQKELLKLQAERKQLLALKRDQVKLAVELKKEKYRAAVQLRRTEIKRLRKEKKIQRIKLVQQSLDREAPLTKACMWGQLDSVMDEIRKGSKPNTETLSAACGRRSDILLETLRSGVVRVGANGLEMVKAVIRCGAKPNEETLTIACKSENIDVVNAVVAAGARADKESLTEACRTKKLQIVQAVIKAGGKPDEYTLEQAVYARDAGIVKAVLQVGAKPSDETLSAACKIADNGYEMAKMVFAAGAQPTQGAFTSVVEAGNPELTALMKQTIAKYPNSLTLACEWNSYGVPPHQEAKNAINLGAKPDSKTLTEACKKYDLELVKCVIAAGAKPEAKTFKEFFSKYKYFNLDILKCLFDASGMTDAEKFKIAKEYDRFEAGLLLVKNGAKPDLNALNLGLRHHNDELVQAAIAAGALVDERMWLDFCYYARLDNVKALVARGDTIPSYALTASLEYSAKFDFIKAMVDLGAKPDDETLSKAVWREDFEIVHLLLKNGAKPDSKSLNAALSNKNIKMAETLIQAGADPNGETLLIYILSTSGFKNFSLVKGEFFEIERLMKAGWINNKALLGQMVQAMIAPGSSALNTACIIIEEGNEEGALDPRIQQLNKEIVKFLLEKGVIPTEDTLDVACEAEDLDLVKMLVDAGAKPNEETLNSACQTENLEIVKLVIAAGAKPDEDTLDNAFWHAPNEEIVKALIQAGAKPNDETLSSACWSKNMDIVRAVVDAGGLPHVLAPDQSGKTSALTQACQSGQYEMVKLMIDLGAEPDNQTFWEACNSGDNRIIQAVLEIGATMGKSSVRDAFESKDKEMILLLLEAGAKPTIKGLKNAIELDDFALVRAMLENGAEPTPEELNEASKIGNVKMVQSLIDWGAWKNSKTSKIANKSGNPKIINLVENLMKSE